MERDKPKTTKKQAGRWHEDESNSVAYLLGGGRRGLASLNLCIAPLEVECNG